MSRYQVWNRNKWAGRNASPEEICYTLDGAMLKAKELSKKASPNGMFFLFGGVPTENYPTMFVLDCSQVPQKVRGVAYKGKWHDAVDNCKSCNNSSINEDSCKLCGGASWSPYRK